MRGVHCTYIIMIHRLKNTRVPCFPHRQNAKSWSCGVSKTNSYMVNNIYQQYKIFPEIEIWRSIQNAFIMFSYILHWGDSITFLCAFSGTFPSTDTFCCGRHTRRGWRNNLHRITWIFAMCILGSRDPLGWGGRGCPCRCQPAKKKYNQLSTCICWICFFFCLLLFYIPRGYFTQTKMS